MQLNLFKTSPQSIFFPPGGEIFFHPQFLKKQKAEYFKDKILAEVPFEAGSITIHGKTFKQPRLIAWYGEREYSYSGYTPKRQDFRGVMRELLEIARKASGTSLRGCLVNWYRDGQDSVGWHADDEGALKEKGATIVSLSLGDTRTFHIRPKKKKGKARVFELGNGDLLIMRGDLQQHWEHGVPKTNKPKGNRINLTFRPY